MHNALLGFMNYLHCMQTKRSAFENHIIWIYVLSGPVQLEASLFHIYVVQCHKCCPLQRISVDTASLTVLQNFVSHMTYSLVFVSIQATYALRLNIILIQRFIHWQIDFSSSCSFDVLSNQWTADNCTGLLICTRILIQPDICSKEFRLLCIVYVRVLYLWYSYGLCSNTCYSLGTIFSWNTQQVLIVSIAFNCFRSFERSIGGVIANSMLECLNRFFHGRDSSFRRFGARLLEDSMQIFV